MCEFKSRRPHHTKENHLKLEEIKSKIILKEGIYYFDWTASGLGFKDIEDEICDILQTYANTHSDCSSCAKITSNYYENARSGLKKLLGLSNDFYLIPCGFGSTAAIKLFQEIMGIQISPITKKALNLNINKENFPFVAVSPYEHHSNEISYRNGLCEIYRTPLKDNYIDWDDLNLNLTKVRNKNKSRKIILSFSATSNVTGIKTDLLKLNKIAREYGAITALDISSLAPYENVDCDLFDAIFVSSHKLLGGVGGCGLLGIKKELCEFNEPIFAGGGTIEYAGKTSVRYFSDFERIMDTGTPPIIQLIRSYLAFRLRNEFGLEKIAKIEKQNLEYFSDQLKKIPNLTCYCPPNLPRLPIFAFNINGFSPYDLAKTLSDNFGVQTRAGCSCAGPYGHDLLGLEENLNFDLKPGWVRVSIHYTHSKDDLDYLLSAINSATKLIKS